MGIYMNNKILNWIAATGMLATLVLAWWLDRWIEIYQQEVFGSFGNFFLLDWAHVLANLFVMAALFALAWLVVFHSSRWVAGLYLIVGGFIALLPGVGISIMTTPALKFLLTPQTGPLLSSLMGTGLVSRYMLASSFIAVTGLAGLVISRRRKFDTT